MHAHAYFGYAAESLPLQTVVDFAALKTTNNGGKSGEAGRKTTGRIVWLS